MSSTPVPVKPALRPPVVEESLPVEPDVRLIPTHSPEANLAARDNIVSDGPGTVQPA